VMRKTGRTEGLRILWAGSAAALVASLALAAGFLLVFSNMKEAGGRTRETFEGVTMLVAVAVLFFTSFWLISRVEGRRWASFLKHQIEGAVTGGRRWAVASLAFLVVFREGAETVLLYASLFASSPGSSPAILAGIGVACVALVILFFASVRGSAVLPVRPFFAITGGLLYVLAFKLAGDAVFELQNAEVFPMTTVTWLPDSNVLRTWLGIYNSAESAALQGVLLLAVVAGLAWTLLKRPGGQAAPAAG
jgi:high-affinity iron transporter